jgi:hypothetical protein
MDLRKFFAAASFVAAVVAFTPSQASADWLFTPFFGQTFNGTADVGGGFTDQFDQKLVYGASLASMGHGLFGFELDFSYAPNFYATSTSSSNLIGDGNVTTLMANIVLGAPLGRVRPYASGGVGLMKSKVVDPGQFFSNVNSNDFGYDAGAGLIGFVSHNVGLRGDLRYFRSLRNTSGVNFELGALKYWRGTLGLTFRF